MGGGGEREGGLPKVTGRERRPTDHGLMMSDEPQGAGTLLSPDPPCEDTS